MKFTMEESAILVRALEVYADTLDSYAERERDYESGGNPESFEQRAKQTRALLKRVQDAPIEETTG